MKRRKLIALLVASAMVIGAVTACDTPATDTSASESSASSETESVTTETTEVTIDLEGYKELSVADVSDEGDDKIMIYGYNSDFWALQKMLAPYAKKEPLTKVLVIGCGGAAKAAALAALKLRMSVSVANRDFRKAREFCFNGGGMIPLRLDQIPKIAPNCDILIYALPVRLDGLDELPLEGRVVVEANYKDPCLQSLCEAAGATYISGIDWLKEQAVAGYRLMTGIEPDEARVRACCAPQ